MQGASAAQKENQEDDDEDDDDDEPEDFMIIPEGCGVAIEGQRFTRSIVRILPCCHHRPIVHTVRNAQADSIKFCGL